MFYNHRHRHRIATLAALLCATGLPVAHAQAHLGLSAPPLLDRSAANRIAHITVIGISHVPTADIVERLTQKLRAATGAVDSSTASAALQDMGLFQSSKVAAAPDPAGGMDFTCTVVENPIVKVIKFTANTPSGKPTVPAEVLIGRMHIPIGQVLNTKTLISDLDGLFNHDTGFVRAQGYLCDVSADINIDPKTGVLLIPLVESFIDKIEIQGSGPVSKAEVLAALQVKTGDLLNTNTVQQGVQRLADLHRFSQIQPFQFTPDQPGKGTLTITLRAPRGPFGTITASQAPPATIAYGGFIGGPVIVPVRVNDHATGNFLLLTNSDLSAISSTFATSLGLTPQPLLEGGRPYFVEDQPASAVPLDRLTLGGTSGVEIENLSLPVSDFSSLSKQIGQTVDGILSADLLSRVAVGIDFPRRRVTFWNHGNLSAAERSAAGFVGGTTIPVAPAYGTLPMLSADAQVHNGATGQTTSMIIATGSQTSLLPTTAATKLGMTPFPNPDDPTILLSRADLLDFAGLSVNAPLFQFTDGNTGATLGLSALSQYRVLLDGPARTACFAPEVTVAGGDPQRKSLAVPFQFDHLTTPYPIVRVSINGRPPLPFLFDTGTADALAIDSQAAQALGLKVEEQASRTINSSIAAKTAPVSTAVLQGRTPAENVTVSLEQAIVTDLSILRDGVIEPRVAGIIGAGMLRDTAVRFDFPRRMLTFFPGGADVPMPPGTLTLPLSERASEGNYFATFTPTAGTPTSEPPVRMLVDTGSSGTELPPEMRGALKPVHSGLSGHWMLGSMALGQSLLLPRLPLAGIPTGELVVSMFPTTDVSGHWHPATLGMNLLSRLSVTLDILHMRLLLGPPTQNSPPVYGGWVGIRLAQKGGQFKITQVLPASPAAKAGLKAGDTVLAVDGRALTGLSLVNARTLADGLAGTPATFLIRRAVGMPKTVRFRRASVSGDPPSPLDGIIGLQEAAKPFVVSAVVPGCPAARAGIAAGDTISAINGQATPEISAEQWQTLVLMTRLTLTVARAGISRTIILTSASPKRTPSHALSSVDSGGGGCLTGQRCPRRERPFRDAWRVVGQASQHRSGTSIPYRTSNIGKTMARSRQGWRGC